MADTQIFEAVVTPLLLNNTGTFGFTYKQSVTKANIFVYSAKTMQQHGGSGTQLIFTEMLNSIN